MAGHRSGHRSGLLKRDFFSDSKLMVEILENKSQYKDENKLPANSD